MLRVVKILCLFCVLSVSAKPPKRIVGGYDAQPGDFPWQVSLNLYGEHICGGSIISSKHILTAAHCVVDVDEDLVNRLIVISGTTDLSKDDGHKYAVKKIIPHEDYQPDKSFLHDIALIAIKGEIKFDNYQSPISLPTYDAPANIHAVVSGWGDTTYPKGLRPSILQTVMLTTLDNELCEEFHTDKIYDTQICAIKKTGVGICQGDSGGPLVYKNELIGISSYSRRGCASGTPDVFVRVQHYLSWIQAAIKKCE